MWQWLRHAFAVQPLHPVAPNERERQVVDQLAETVVRRNLTVPALLFLESSRPMNYVGSQALVFFQPMASWLFKGDSYRVFQAFLERRESIEYICRRIEHFSSRSSATPAAASRECGE